MAKRIGSTGQHQNVGRASAVLSAVADGGQRGVRAVDVSRITGLGKATVHRVLAGLLEHGLVEQDHESNRLFIGLRILTWASAVRERYGLAQLAEPCLQRLVELSGDTVYLSMRTGDQAVCLARREGSFPIKTLTLTVGDRRHLGISGGSLAILAALSDQEIEDVLIRQSVIRREFPFDETRQRRMIAETRKAGAAYYGEDVYFDGKVISDMAAVAVAVRTSEHKGTLAAISIATVKSRLVPARRRTLIDALKAEAAELEDKLQKLG